MSASVHVSGLTLHYRGRPAPALDDVTLDVPAGSTLTVVGPSGGGKSSLLSVVAGLVAPSAGGVRIGPSDVTAAAPGERGVALMLQQPHLFPHLSVGENVAFAAAARGVGRAERRAIADRWLRRVGLDGAAGRRTHELSGGEQQRVALVRALSAEPRVLLLDEPLASLDPPVRAGLQTMLRGLVADTGVTVIFVTHDLPEAMALGDRTAVLVDGRVEAFDTPEGVYRRPPTVAAARFVGFDLVVAGTAADGVVRTPAGPLAVDAARGLRGVVTLALRSRALAVADGGDPANVIDGEVIDVVYRGEHWAHTVATAVGPIELSAGAPLPAGTAVRLRVPAGAPVVVRDGPAGAS